VGARQTTTVRRSIWQKKSSSDQDPATDGVDDELPPGAFLTTRESITGINTNMINKPTMSRDNLLAAGGAAPTE